MGNLDWIPRLRSLMIVLVKCVSIAKQFCPPTPVKTVRVRGPRKPPKRRSSRSVLPKRRT